MILFLREGHFGCSRSSKVTELVTNLKRVHFLLVTFVLSGTISEILQLLCAPDPTPIHPNFEGVPIAPDRPRLSQRVHKPEAIRP